MPIDMSKVREGNWETTRLSQKCPGNWAITTTPVFVKHPDVDGDNVHPLAKIFHNREVAELIAESLSEDHAKLTCLLKNAMDVMERRRWEVRCRKWASGPEWMACGPWIDFALRTPERTLTALYEAMIAEDERLTGEGPVNSPAFCLSFTVNPSGSSTPTDR